MVYLMYISQFEPTLIQKPIYCSFYDNLYILVEYIWSLPYRYFVSIPVQKILPCLPSHTLFDLGTCVVLSHPPFTHPPLLFISVNITHGLMSLELFHQFPRLVSNQLLSFLKTQCDSLYVFN